MIKDFTRLSININGITSEREGKKLLKIISKLNVNKDKQNKWQSTLRPSFSSKVYTK